MPKKAREYTRLPGRGRGFFRYNTLWLGKDHLLSIHSRIFSEDYKRFYYGDIQAIVTGKTESGRIRNILLGLLSGFFLLLAATSESIESLTSLGVLTALPLLLLLVNWWRGPTCVCHLRTAVQTERLPSLNRLPTVQKAMDRLRPLVEEAQGAITPDARKAKGSEWHRSENLTAKIDRASPPKRQERGAFHQILFYLLLLGGPIIGIDLLYDHIVFTLLGMLIGTGVAICVIIALVRQHKSDMTGTLRGVTWGSLGFVCFSAIVGYIRNAVLLVENGGKNFGFVNNQWELIKMVSARSVLDSSWLTGLYLFSILCCFAIGGSGLIALRTFQRQHHVPPVHTRKHPSGGNEACTT